MFLVQSKVNDIIKIMTTKTIIVVLFEKLNLKKELKFLLHKITRYSFVLLQTGNLRTTQDFSKSIIRTYKCILQKLIRTIIRTYNFILISFYNR